MGLALRCWRFAASWLSVRWGRTGDVWVFVRVRQGAGGWVAIGGDSGSWDLEEEELAGARWRADMAAEIASGDAGREDGVDGVVV